MSAFLGPIHFWLYNKIQFQESLIDELIRYAADQGFSDDLAAIGMALVLAQAYLTPEINEKAKDRIRSIFGEKAFAKLEA